MTCQLISTLEFSKSSISLCHCNICTAIKDIPTKNILDPPMPDNEEHRPSIMDAFKKITPKAPSAASKAGEKPLPKQSQLISAEDFFGTSTIQRTSHTPKVKRKAVS